MQQKNSLYRLSKTNANTQKTIHDLKDINDSLYMIGTGATGAGVAEIVIAAVVLSCRERRKIDTFRMHLCQIISHISFLLTFISNNIYTKIGLNLVAKRYSAKES